MRSPIQDANAGATMDVAPTKKHAVRTATVAYQGNNNAQRKADQISNIASTLGGSLDKFMEGKKNVENERRYTEAFHNQGLRTGMSEYQKDLRKTGFTEFIYGGQSPEYQGALDASARNASNAMLLEEQEYIESEEGMALSPAEYQLRIQDKVTAYNQDNFAETPDAAFAFMKNWKDNSNELTRAQYKNNQVHQQQEARRTVADGFQTDLDVYKSTLRSNPNKAYELGQKMYSMDNKPDGMSDTAYRSVLIEEGLTAIQGHDFSALKLMNESGIVKSFDRKTLKAFQTAQGVIDTDNFNMSEAARLQYKSIIDNDSSSYKEVARARQEFDATRLQVQARNTGTSKHIKTTFGSDRWRGELGKQYQNRLKAEASERDDRRNKAIDLNASSFQAQLYGATPERRRTILADRLDELQTAINGDLPDAVRTDLNGQFVAGKKQLERWQSAEDAQRKKEDEKLEQKEKEDRDIEDGVTSLVTGGGYVTGDSKNQNLAIKGAVESVANQIIPDTEMKGVDKLEAILGDPANIYKFIKGSGNFKGYVTDSKEVKTAVKNLAVKLQGELTEDNTFAPSQQQNAAALGVLQQQNPQLYNASFTAEERLKNAYMMNAINTDKGVAETVRTLDTIAISKDTATVSKFNGEDVAMKAGVGNAPMDVQDMVYAEYKMHLPLGSDVALDAARKFAQGVNTFAGGVTVRYGSTFEAVQGRNLDDTMKILSKTYKSGEVYKTGFSEALSRLVGGSKDATGNELYNLKQVPGVKTSIFQGGIMLEYQGRVQMIPRNKIEVEMNGYNEWYRGTESIRPRAFWE